MPGKEKIKITNEARRVWLTIRKAWITSRAAFAGALSLISTKQAEELYNIVCHSLYKDSYAQILQEHPELREIIKSDEDRLCMHDIYEVLSWRLDRKELPPKEFQLVNKMKTRIGREIDIPPIPQ